MGNGHDENDVDIGPWRRLTQQQVYDNPWIQVTHEEVLTPAGTPGIYGRIHFKNCAIGIVPLADNGDTWLVGQYRYALDEYSWEIPMGGGALQIEPLNAAQRELQEETGMSATHWECLLKLHTSNSVTDEKGYVFLARGLSEGQQQLEDSESDLVVRRLPLSEAVDWIFTGRLTDAVSVAGLLATERWLRQREGE